MIHIIIKHYALKIWLIKFKEQCKVAVTEKLTQLHVPDTFYPVDTNKPTKQIVEAVA